jgi:hypothetical protein
MKAFFRQRLRRLFSPLLNVFEQGTDPYLYKSMNRKILIAMGLMFAGLSAVLTMNIIANETYGYFIPVIVFSSVALVSIIVGTLGNERAVAKIWGNK